jgi:hypothetical protein
MRHDIVTSDFLLGGSGLNVDIADMGFKLRYLRLGNRKAKFMLSPCQGDPKLSPGRKSALFREKRAHLL